MPKNESRSLWTALIDLKVKRRTNWTKGVGLMCKSVGLFLSTARRGRSFCSCAAVILKTNVFRCVMILIGYAILYL